jgi:hypothetical protein
MKHGGIDQCLLGQFLPFPSFCDSIVMWQNNVYDQGACFSSTLVLGYGIVRIVSGGFQKLFLYCSTITEPFPEDGPETGD